MQLGHVHTKVNQSINTEVNTTYFDQPEIRKHAPSFFQKAVYMIFFVSRFSLKLFHMSQNTISLWRQVRLKGKCEHINISDRVSSHSSEEAIQLAIQVSKIMSSLKGGKGRVQNRPVRDNQDVCYLSIHVRLQDLEPSGGRAFEESKLCSFLWGARPHKIKPPREKRRSLWKLVNSTKKDPSIG